jgi:hypothetical protein
MRFLIIRRFVHWMRFGRGREIPPFLPIRWLHTDHGHRLRAAEGFLVGEHVCLDCGAQIPRFIPPDLDPLRIHCPLCGGRQSRWVDLTRFYEKATIHRKA